VCKTSKEASKQSNERFSSHDGVALEMWDMLFLSQRFQSGRSDKTRRFFPISSPQLPNFLLPLLFPCLVASPPLASSIVYSQLRVPPTSTSPHPPLIPLIITWILTLIFNYLTLTRGTKVTDVDGEVHGGSPALGAVRRCVSFGVAFC
jgi:hypothetical protein